MWRGSARCGASVAASRAITPAHADYPVLDEHARAAGMNVHELRRVSDPTVSVTVTSPVAVLGNRQRDSDVAQDCKRVVDNGRGVLQNVRPPVLHRPRLSSPRMACVSSPCGELVARLEGGW